MSSRRKVTTLEATLAMLAAVIPVGVAVADTVPPPFSMAMIPGGAVTNAMLANSSVTLGSTAVSLGGTVTMIGGLSKIGVGSSPTAPGEFFAGNAFVAGGVQPTLLVGRRPDGTRASLGLGYDQTHSWNFDTLGDGSLEFWSYNGSFNRQFYMPQGGPGTFVDGINGADYTLGTTSSTPQIVYVGTSLTFGTGGSHPYNFYVAPPTYNGVAFNSSNIGISGELVSTMISKVPQNLNPLFASNAGVNIAVLQGGDNDMASGGLSAAQTFSLMQRLSQHLRDMGWQTIVLTNISRTGQDGNKNAYNALLRANWSQFADALADVGADSRLGADGAYSNTTYFNVDGVHPNDTGYPIMAGIVQTTLTNLATAGKAAPAIATFSPEQTSGFSWTGLVADNYRLTCEGLIPSSAGANIVLQLGEGTVDSVSWKTSGYQYAQQANGVSGTSNPIAASTSANGILIADNVKASNGGVIVVEIFIGALSKSVQHGATSRAFKASNGGDAYYHLTGGGTYTTDTTAITGVRLQAATGSISSGYCRLRQENS